MKRLVIHSGMAKTGSSSIQESLWQARDELAEQGVYYPPWQPFNHSYEVSALFRTARTGGFLYRQMSPISDEDWAAELERLRQRWEEFLRADQPGTYLVSAESLEHFSGPELENFTAFAASGFDRVEVIMYVRDPRSAISSRFEQAVKQLREPADPQVLLAAAKQQARFGLLRRWQDVSGIAGITVRPFDRSQFPGGELINDFLDALGLARIAHAVTPETANTSLGENAVAFLLAHNARFPQYTADGPNPARGLSTRQELFYRLIRAIQDRPLALDIRFDAEEARQINAEIDFVNRFLPATAAFARVEASAEPTALPRPGDVPVSFLGELVNALALELDQSLDNQRHLSNVLEKMRLEAQDAGDAAPEAD